MSDNSEFTARARQFAADVRRELSALSSDQVSNLTDDLEADVEASLRDGGELSTPREYAIDMALAAGISLESTPASGSAPSARHRQLLAGISAIVVCAAVIGGVLLLRGRNRSTSIPVPPTTVSVPPGCMLPPVLLGGGLSQAYETVVAVQENYSHSSVPEAATWKFVFKYSDGSLVPAAALQSSALPVISQVPAPDTPWCGETLKITVAGRAASPTSNVP